MKKTNYSTDIEALSMPWTESPFFEDLLYNSDIDDMHKGLARHYNQEGYVTIDLKLDDDLINRIDVDVNDLIEKEKATLQSKHFDYSNSPRVFEAWRESSAVKELVLNKQLMHAINFLYQKEPLPFSTINFLRGSQQPLHSDTVHFHTVPKLWMCGAWVALEDVGYNNGSLRIVPGSHKWADYDYHDLNLPLTKSIKDGEKINYRRYEEFVRQLVKSKNVSEKVVELKKGQAIIWASNLLHGGIPIKDPKSTRKTQAIHYFFKGCDKYYHPMFSDPASGDYAKKWCDENNYIKEDK